MVLNLAQMTKKMASLSLKVNGLQSRCRNVIFAQFFLPLYEVYTVVLIYPKIQGVPRNVTQKQDDLKVVFEL